MFRRGIQSTFRKEYTATLLSSTVSSSSNSLIGDTATCNPNVVSACQLRRYQGGSQYGGGPPRGGGGGPGYPPQQAAGGFYQQQPPGGNFGRGGGGPPGTPPHGGAMPPRGPPPGGPSPQQQFQHQGGGGYPPQQMRGGSGGGGMPPQQQQQQQQQYHQQQQQYSQPPQQQPGRGAPPPPPPSPVAVENQDGPEVIDQHGNKVETPLTLKSFQQLADFIPDWLWQGLRSLHYTNPTEVQTNTIPLILQGRDLIGLGPTGSGKTLAFALPMLAKMDMNSLSGKLNKERAASNERNLEEGSSSGGGGGGESERPSEWRGPRQGPVGTPQLVIIAPVRELASQTAKAIRKLTYHQPDLAVVECYGGGSRREQLGEIGSGCDVVVATPGRLSDFLESADINFSKIRGLVVDEADRMLDDGFAPQLEKIFQQIPQNIERQTLMFSATWPTAVQSLGNNFLRADRMIVRTGETQTWNGMGINKNIEQVVLVTETLGTMNKLLKQLTKEGKIGGKTRGIVFCETKKGAEFVAREIRQHLSLSPNEVDFLHGGLKQLEREFVLNKFRAGKTRALVATSVASRGLDFPKLDFVMNYDMPQALDDYVHRIGRTGRAGAKGNAYTFIRKDRIITRDPSWLHDLVEYLKASNQRVLPSLEQFVATIPPRSMWQGGGGHGGGNGDIVSPLFHQGEGALDPSAGGGQW